MLFSVTADSARGLTSRIAAAVVPLNCWTRTGLCLCAFGGTALYAVSLQMQIAFVVGIAAAIAWLVLGGLLLTRCRDRRQVLAWFDVCLKTMTLGIAVLTVAALINVFGWTALAEGGHGSFFSVVGLLSGNFFMLLLADVLMMLSFVMLGRKVRDDIPFLVELWVFVLNGSFVLVMILLVFLWGAWQ